MFRLRIGSLTEPTLRRERPRRSETLQSGRIARLTRNRTTYTAPGTPCVRFRIGIAFFVGSRLFAWWIQGETHLHRLPDGRRPGDPGACGGRGNGRRGICPTSPQSRRRLARAGRTRTPESTTPWGPARARQSSDTSRGPSTPRPSFSPCLRASPSRSWTRPAAPDLAWPPRIRLWTRTRSPLRAA